MENVQTHKDSILIIEDNAFMAEILADKLSKHGFDIFVSTNGQDGLNNLSKTKPSIVILDMPLSGPIDGYGVLTAIRKTYDIKSLPIITLFNVEDQENQKKSLEMGASLCLIKAYNSTEEIIDKVDQIIKGTLSIDGSEVVKKTTKASGTSKDEAVKKISGYKTEVILEAPRKIKAEVDKLLTLPESEVPIISFVDKLLEYAYLARASDIHIEPMENGFVIRLRIDGILHDLFKVSKSLLVGVIARIKILSGMRTDEHQASQDGRFKTQVENPSRKFDVRVSVVPTYYGENAVLRLLSEQTQIAKLDDLALTDLNKSRIKRAIEEPYGMILATGPTGSGKTTTLYTILKEVNTRDVSVITIEDPIEYSLEGIDQIQVNVKSGLTFANGLRSILRQDPNIIMVGEIRDEETASIAVNAALTGHKMLSTLHTNDSATTLPRLLDMRVEPFLIASTVNVAIGQRLVRTICPNCKAEKTLTDVEIKNLSEKIPPEILDSHYTFYYGKGCDACGDSGYFGRMGIYEVLEVDDFIRAAIMKKADAGEIRKIAVKNGMTTIIEDGFNKALAGLTTIEEVLRVVHE